MGAAAWRVAAAPRGARTGCTEDMVRGREARRVDEELTMTCAAARLGGARAGEGVRVRCERVVAQRVVAVCALCDGMRRSQALA